MTRPVLAVLFALLAGCAHPGPPVSSPAVAQAPFERSPSGTFEISPEALLDVLAQGSPKVRVVDVRERDELSGELGMIAGAESVPLGELAQASQGWSRDEAIVLVCRSGRRSERGAAQLASLGFRHAAFMTGGMQRVHDLGLPVEHVEPTASP